MENIKSVRIIFLVIILWCVVWPSIIMSQTRNIPTALNPNKLLSMEFVEADLQDVLRLLSKQNGFNLIVNENISGVVTVHFTKVTLKGALDAILIANGYDYLIQDNILIIKPIDSDMRGELVTKVFNLDYVTASDISAPLEDVLTEKGRIQIFSRSSKLSTDYIATGSAEDIADILVITDEPENIPEIEELIRQLDLPPAQVMISVKFIETTLSENEQMGIDWTTKAKLSGGPAISQPDGLATISSGATGGAGSTGGGLTGLGLGAIKDLNLAILSIQEFELLLEMLQATGKSKLLSDPRVATLDNQRAIINVETEVTVIIPTVATGAGGAVATETAEKITIAISLLVLPHVHKNGYITLAVEPTVEAITGYSGPDLDQPIISRRLAATQVRVNNGETIAIGGLIKEDVRQTEKKVPFLGNIPIIGRLLFTSTSNEIEKSDLLIFITPHIIYSETES